MFRADTGRVAADRKRIARDSYAAFATGDRAFFEDHLSEGFRFSAPPDPQLDRDGWFERCRPGAGRGQRFEFVRLIEAGDEVVVTYEIDVSGGGRGRNTEVITFDAQDRSPAPRCTSAGTWPSPPPTTPTCAFLPGLGRNAPFELEVPPAAGRAARRSQSAGRRSSVRSAHNAPGTKRDPACPLAVDAKPRSRPWGAVGDKEEACNARRPGSQPQRLRR